MLYKYRKNKKKWNVVIFIYIYIYIYIYIILNIKNDLDYGHIKIQGLNILETVIQGLNLHVRIIFYY